MTDMTIAEHRRLGEALKGTDIAGIHPTLKLLCDAARLTYDRWQECGECGGKGFTTGHSGSDGVAMDCPSCKGRGIRPNQERLGAVARAIGMADVPDYGSSQQEHYDRLAEAAVRAFDKEPDHEPGIGINIKGAQDEREQFGHG